MNVEITGRQTGKTTRLVDDVVNFLETNGDKSVLIVAFNSQTRKNIKQKIMDKCGLPCLNRTITSHKMLPPPLNSMKQYVDEFFYMDENKLVVDKNAYYCGTPKDGLHGLYEIIYNTFQLRNGNMVPIKPIKRHGFGGNN